MFDTSFAFPLEMCAKPSYEYGVLWPLPCEFFIGIHSPRLGKVALFKTIAGKLNAAPKGTLVKFRTRNAMKNVLQRKKIDYEAIEADVLLDEKLDQILNIEVVHGYISRLEDGYGWVTGKMRNGWKGSVHFKYWSLWPIHHCIPFDDAGMKLREARVK